MQCKVSNRLTPLELRNITPEEEDMEAMEDMKVVEDTEVEEHLVVVEGRLSTINVVSKVTMHGTIRQLPAPIVMPSITLLKSA